ncbi:hypothetical protein MKW98_007542 [Papaver atlanticum]|uniref:Cytochrome P450 n=1 Tax=Papaver atlanticum TaxID=357466 RepID=A0AAD4XCN6_9MAGN|nr:hypothetical protein MKW98_007542 [Papaver atlanticum]
MDALSNSYIPACFMLFICFLSIALFLKKTSQAIDYWLFLGSFPSVVMNSNRIPDWFTEVFTSLGRGSFFVDGPIFSNLKYFVTCHHQNIEYILKTNFNNFPKGPDFKQVFSPLGDGIFNADSESWRVQRRMAHTAFISAEFKNLISNISRQVVEDQLVPLLVHVAKTGSTIDLQEVCSRFAFDVNMNAIFGLHGNYLSTELPSNDLAEAIGDVQEAVFFRHTMPMFVWKLMRLFRIGRERELLKAVKTIDAHFYEHISQKQKHLIQGVKTFDLLSSYINEELNRTKIPSLPPKNDDEFLRDSMLSLFVAGKDTIASGLIWFFWLVSKTPSVEKKISEELAVLLSSKMGQLSEYHEWPWVFHSDDTNGLVYLHAALCESLRLYPPVPINSKTVLNEVVLPDGRLIKPGTQVLIPFYSVGRMPWIWGEDCLEFKPERWMDGDGKLARHENAAKFFTFNIGPRTCLGKDMSFTQLKAVAAAVLLNFHVEVLEGQHVCPKPAITLHMKKDLQVKIHKRVI